MACSLRGYFQPRNLHAAFYFVIYSHEKDPGRYAPVKRKPL